MVRSSGPGKEQCADGCLLMVATAACHWTQHQVNVSSAVLSSVAISTACTVNQYCVQQQLTVKVHTSDMPCVVCAGPLTNIAMALKVDLHFQQRIHKLGVMGGAEAIGNISPVAEFNFHCDPEAARLVLHKFAMTTLLTWEATKLFSLPWDFIDQWLGKTTVKSIFMACELAGQMREHHGLTRHCCMHADHVFCIAFCYCASEVKSAHPRRSQQLFKPVVLSSCLQPSWPRVQQVRGA